MWIRKTDEEITEEESKHKSLKFKVSLKGPIAIFVITLILTFFHHLTGFTKLPGPSEAHSLIEVFYMLPEILIFCLSFSGLIYFWQYFTKENFFEREDSSTLVCDKCNKLKTNDGKNICDCGGSFVDIRKMKWIEDES